MCTTGLESRGFVLFSCCSRAGSEGGDQVKRGWLIAILVGSLVAGSAWAQQKKKEPKGQAQEAVAAASQLLSPEEQINKEISEMLAAWQIGDMEMLHKYYADDVTVVSGLYQPLLAGWQSFAAATGQQRKRVQGPQIVRRNTYVRVRGDVAWASYQWEFSGLVDGQSQSYRGHTTLVFLKQGDRWWIVHNHTSVVPELQTPAPPPSPTALPQKPAH
jgi:uncharacterized protein (TIGR02246 family)